MSSLISTSQKAAFNAVISNVHDTFERTIYALVKQEQEVQDLNTYNALYKKSKNASSSSFSDVFSRVELKARIHYPNEQAETNDTLGGQYNLSVSKGMVRLKVSNEVLQVLLNSSKVEVDGTLYVMVTDDKVIGPFVGQLGSGFHTIYLRREN